MEVEIQDSVGETNRRREPVSVRVPPGQESWTEVLVDLETSLSSEPEQLWQYYDFVGLKVNLAAADIPAGDSGSAEAIEDAS